MSQQKNSNLVLFAFAVVVAIGVGYMIGRETTAPMSQGELVVKAAPAAKEGADKPAEPFIREFGYDR